MVYPGPMAAKRSGRPSQGADVLGGLAVAVRCNESWRLMDGDERARRCKACGLQVYDLQGLERDAALACLGAATFGAAPLLRVYRRPDGRVVAADCQTVLAVRQRRRRLLLATTVGLLLVLGAQWLVRARHGKSPTDFRLPSLGELIAAARAKQAEEAAAPANPNIIPMRTVEVPVDAPPAQKK